MKFLQFSDNTATIAGRKVPYSLLGAAAAILGAILIWMQFRNGGGLGFGDQSGSLSDLLGGGGDAGGTGDGSLGDLSGSQGNVSGLPPIITYGTPIPISGPTYSADTGHATTDVTKNTGGIVPYYDPGHAAGERGSEGAGVAAGGGGGSASVLGGAAASALANALKAPPKPPSGNKGGAGSSSKGNTTGTGPNSVIGSGNSGLVA
jgi:hypothetical protein